MLKSVSVVIRLVSDGTLYPGNTLDLSVTPEVAKNMRTSPITNAVEWVSLTDIDGKTFIVPIGRIRTIEVAAE